MDWAIEWARDHWDVVYVIGGLICGGLSMLITFVGIWWFAAYKYALGGLVLGWLPAGIAAVVAAVVCGYGWPLIVVLLLAFGRFIPAMLEEAEYRAS